MAKGRMKYVPGPVLGEIQNIMGEEHLTKECEAFNKMMMYSQIGREVTKQKNNEPKKKRVGLFGYEY